MDPAWRLLLFGLVVTTVWFALHAYLARALLRTLGPRARACGRLVLGALALWPVAVMTAGRLLPGARGVAVTGGFFAMGVSSVLVGLVFARDMARWALHLRGRLGTRRRTQAPVVDPGRRAFLQRGVDSALMGGAVGLSALGWHEAVRLPRVRRVTIPVPGLPPALAGLTIVQLSDIHVGPTIGRDDLAGLVRLTNAQAPDIVAITGDLVDGFVPDLGPELAPLSDLRAREGVFFVTGNHEYYWDGPAWCRFLAARGIQVLLNEHRVIERGGARLVVAGIPDHRAGRHVPDHTPDAARAVAGRPPGVPVVMLAHQPRSAGMCAAAGAHVMLCGHTHGGQYFPMNLLIHLFQPYVAGLHRHGAMQVYVSRGSGYWGPPNRLGAPSEVTRIELVPA